MKDILGSKGGFDILQCEDLLRSAEQHLLAKDLEEARVALAEALRLATSDSDTHVNQVASILIPLEVLEKQLKNLSEPAEKQMELAL